MEFKTKRKIFLVYMFGITTFFNLSVYFYLQQYSVEIDYSKIIARIEAVKNSNAEITKEQYLKALEQRKVAFESTDEIIVGLDKILQIIVTVNVIIMGLICLVWWRELKRVEYKVS